MEINREEHPHIQFRYDVDGVVHAFTLMGDAWCEEEVDDDGAAPTGPPGDWDWCDGCLEALREEGAVT